MTRDKSHQVLFGHEIDDILSASNCQTLLVFSFISKRERIKNSFQNKGLLIQYYLAGKIIIIGIWGKYYSLQRYHNNYWVKEMRLMKLIVVISSSHKDEASTQLVPAMPFVPTGRDVNENQLVRK